MTWTRRGWLWTGLLLSFVVVVAAMAWISFEARRIERQESEGWAAAERGERLRLALWRMDSLLATLFAQETARPYFEYSAFYPARRAYNRMFAELESGEVLVPSPLLTFRSAVVRIHFQLDPEGRLSSPQVPQGNMQDLAEAQFLSHESHQAAARTLAEIEPRLDRSVLLRELEGTAALVEVIEPLVNPIFEKSREVWTAGRRGQTAQVDLVQSEIDENEYNVRKLVCATQTVNGVALPLGVESCDDLDGRGARPSSTIRPGPVGAAGVLHALWIDDALLLARRVRVEQKEYVQGCWLDRQALERWLVGAIDDLLPGAKLERMEEGSSATVSQLASLPLRLAPGQVPQDQDAPRSPVGFYVGSLYVGMTVAAGALLVLVLGAVTLSERRRDFVSAVTHEMRTPLTTFRLYTEMLAEGMVEDPEKQRSYLLKLKREAERLGHLVENVLAFARLESGRARREVERVNLGRLLARVEERLSERADQDEMELVIHDEGALGVEVDVDASAVEQILLNLVDNACKYAKCATNRRIEITAIPGAKQVTLRVRDHGTGITLAGRRRLFRPFSKSVDEAAVTAPGVGLGLALSRRFSREMGGELSLDESADGGAAFLLALPRAL